MYHFFSGAHIWWQFAPHPILMFVLLNMKNKQSAMSTTSFAIKQLPNETAITKDDLQEMFSTKKQNSEN